MIYDKAFFDAPFDRHGVACEKWDGMEKEQGKKLNPMWVADMDFVCPTEVTDALRERAAHPAYGYTYETEESVEALLSFMKRRHQVELKPEEHLLLPCVVTGLKAAVQSLTQPGDRVIIQPPVYGPFRFSILDNGRETAECRLFRSEDGRYSMDLDAVEKACREGAKLMMICNPHNPVGRCWSREELSSLMKVLAKYQIPLVSDEIHEDFVYEKGGFVPVLSLPEAETLPVAALTSASKTFNLAGLQQAVAFSRNGEMLDGINKALRAAGVTSGNIFAMVATEAAYRYGDAWLDAMLAYVHEGEGLFRAEVAKRLPKAVISPLEATYLGWIDLRAYGLTTDQLIEKCREAGVEFTPGTFFDEKEGDGFLRVNYACPHARILEAAEQLEKAVLGK